MMRLQGLRVSYIDCQDRFHPKAAKKSATPVSDGRGPYVKTLLPKPAGLSSVKRNYSRYGILPEWFDQEIRSLPKPDVVLVTCMMTYWYPGLFETIRAVRSVYPNIPVVLGGIYATLCRDHAVASSGADVVLSGPGETRIFEIIEEITGFACVSLKFDPENLDSYPYPAFDLQRKIPYVPLLTSRGCPFSCTYCASNILQPKRMVMSPERVVEEITHWQDYCGVENFAFYDDALLVNAQAHATPMFQKIIATGRKLRFHTPNAVHIREITPEIAELMLAAGVQTLRLGLETLEFWDREIDRKVREEEFVNAIYCLLAAGFRKEQVGAYLLVGLPGQDTVSVERSIRLVKQSGITPILAYYTPIPHTQMWAAAVAASRYDLASDPVFTNNAIMPCQRSEFEWEELARLKKLIQL